ncbi:NADH:flavin oxidoreductase/NADH oxidase [Aureobasidium pullulans]|nr:NADH:flavin oxidoreductase/NADH oxidase [Aureobasidium pullulans]
MPEAISHHNITENVVGESKHINRAAPGAPYFTPLQSPPAGAAFVREDGKTVPKLFQPLKLRGLTLPNRIFLSPLCQYSAEDGHMTDYHLAHIGGIVKRGPGMTIIEATAVTPEGRITPEDVGLWKDSQIAPMKRVVDFAHSQNQLITIQLAHAGRKASCVAPWSSAAAVAPKEQNGWPDNVLAPSAIPWNEHHANPRAMTLEDIESFKKSYADAVRRALTVGFDAIEVHAAHGYLLCSFLSPTSNQRTDKYGGSFENRTRLLLETVDLVREIIPETMPLFVRVSGTEWLEEVEEIKESWTSDQTVKLGEILAERGVDLMDISSGGNHPKQHPHAAPGYQAPLSKAVKKAVGDKMAVSAVGSIHTGKLANELLEEGLDVIMVGRLFQKNPGVVFAFAEELGVEVNMPNQIRWGWSKRGASQLKTLLDSNL